MFKEKDIQNNIKKIYSVIEQQNTESIINTKKNLNKELVLSIVFENEIEHTIKM